MDLNAVLTGQILTFFGVFSRVGATMMVIPGFGDESLNAQLRLALALAVSFVLVPAAAPFYGAPPSGPLALAGFLGAEAAVGLLIGATARVVMSAVNVAGQVISMQTGLAVAQTVDPTQRIQGALIGSFLSVAAVTLIFIADIHHLMLAAMRDSYRLFAPGALPPMADAAALITDTLAGAFALGMQLSAPFLTFGLVFYLGMGLIARMMPQVQIFFVAMPANILLGFVILMLMIGLMLTVFLQHFEGVIVRFLA